MTRPTDRDVQAGEASLFEDLAPPSQSQLQQAQAESADRRSQGAMRLLEPNRSQIELRDCL